MKRFSLFNSVNRRREMNLSTLEIFFMYTYYALFLTFDIFTGNKVLPNIVLPGGVPVIWPTEQDVSRITLLEIGISNPTQWPSQLPVRVYFR